MPGYGGSLRHPHIIMCRWVHVLAPHEHSAAARHAASTPAGLGGVLDGQPDFLTKRHLQGMAVGVAEEGHIPDGRTSVSRPVEEPPFPTRQRAQPIHFLTTRACHTQVGGRDERMVDLAPLGEDDDEGARYITQPRHLEQGSARSKPPNRVPSPVKTSVCPSAYRQYRGS